MGETKDWKRELLIRWMETKQNKDPDSDIAIVGISGRYPMADDLDSFWDLIKNGKSAITEVPKDRWDAEVFYHNSQANHDMHNTKWGGFINGADRFDPLLFHMSPLEAEQIDPQERLMLQTVWEVFEDAGYTRNNSNRIGQQVGVFIGAMNSDYEVMGGEEWGRSRKSVAHSSFWSFANRISYVFDLQGPSLTIDTACSSSLTAVHLACESLKRGECEMAIAGGVNLILHPSHFSKLSKMNMLSDSAQCRVFGEGADGFVDGEGGGAVLLKPLHQAVADGDRIYGVVKGSAMNAGGKTGGYTVPNPSAQSDLIGKVLKKSGIDPETISYVEAHGTGTALGDPIEVRSLTNIYNRYTDKKQFCAIGSVKANIGHLESAAGIAGLTKILLQFKYKQLTPSIYSDPTNPEINFAETPFYLNKSEKEWGTPYSGALRRAAISSFGAGGANAHVILEEYIQDKVEDSEYSSIAQLPYIFVLSAKTDERLRAYATRLLQFILQSESKGEKVNLLSLAYTLQVGRELMEERIAILAHNEKDLKQKLERLKASDDWSVFNDHEGIFLGSVRLSKTKERTAEEIKHQSSRTPEELAKSWATGYAINWTHLYNGLLPKRGAAPFYPFADERYWVEDSPPFNEMQEKQKALEANERGITYYTRGYVETTETIPVALYTQPTILLVSDESKESAMLYQKLEENGPVVHLELSTSSSRNSARSFTTNSKDNTSINKLFEQLEKEQLCPDTIIFYRANPYEAESWILDETQNGDIGTIKQLLQASYHSGQEKLRHFIYLYNAEDNYHYPLEEAVSGYGASLQLTMPNVIFKTIRRVPDSDGYRPASEIVIDELSLSEQKGMEEVQYVGGKRFVNLVLQKQFSSPFISSKLRRGATYVVTGGMGGLGYLFAQYLAKTYSSTLVLIGRSAFDNAMEEKVAEITQLGGKAHYIQANVADLSSMKECMKQIHKLVGPIHGVLHAAGSSTYKPILERTDREIRETLFPKIDGTLILDEVTKEEPLEIFAMFSSVSSVIGDLGQGDYAIGNRFLDQYAAYRNHLQSKGQRQGITCSIGWPLWKEGGMHFSPEAEQLILGSSGMEYLDTRSGIHIFERALTAGESFLLAIKGDTKRFNFTVQDNQQRVPSLKEIHEIDETVTEILDHSSNQEVGVSVRASLQRDLARIASAIVKMQESKMKPSENLSHYGFDSIRMKELASEIANFTGIKVTPALFFAHSSVESIALFLCQEYPDKIEGIYRNKFGVSQQRKAKVKENKEKKTEEKQTTLPLNPEHGREIAVIGMAGVFPKSENIDQFWDNLCSETDLVTIIPQERWDWKDFYGNPETDPGKSISKWGAFIDDVDKFDAEFFRISPMEAELMDPQHRLFLQCAYTAIEHAGYPPSKLKGSQTGIFAGVQFNDYLHLLGDINEGKAQLATGTSHALLANRLSYLFDFHGPSESIDTACSSSLVAVNRAVRSLQNGECSLAIAGGVSLMLTPESMIGASQMGVLSKDGKCKTFDKDADGFVKGEGVGIVILKPLSLAIADSDQIYAVIKGCAVNHGGKASSLTAPNSESQADLLFRAYQDAGIPQDTITFIEMHGTGTALGDPVEVEGLKMAFQRLEKASGKSLKRGQYCSLGSVKTNMGHLEPASGIAGLIKVILAMKHQTLPANLHLKEMNPYIELEGSPFGLVNNTKQWVRLKNENGKPIPLRAGVSSFGFGGANAHIVLEEYEDNRTSDIPIRSGQQVFVLSAKNKESLKKYAEKFFDCVTTVLQKAYSETVNPSKQIKSKIIDFITELLNVPLDQVEMNEPISQLGLDPFQRNKLLEWIQKNTEYICHDFFDIEELCFIDLIDFRSKKTDGVSPVSHIQNSENRFRGQTALFELIYSCQTSKEEMEERLAIVVDNLEELHEKLGQYIRNGTTEDGYYGNVKDTAWQELWKDQVMEPVMEAFTRQGDAHKLAQYWVAGAKIPWEIMYADVEVRKMTLPGYPFAKKRYWVPNLSRTTTRSSKTEHVVTEEEDTKDIYLFEPYWEEILEQNSNRVSTSEGRILLFVDQDEVERSGLSPNTIVVIKGARRKFNDYLYAVNPEEEYDFVWLFQQLEESGKLPDTVVFAWLIGVQGNKFMEEWRNKKLEGETPLLTALKYLFVLHKGLVSQKEKTVKSLYVVIHKNEQDPLATAVSGFSRSCSFYLPETNMKVLRVEDTLLKSGLVKLIDTEQAASESGVSREVLYQGGRRFIKRLRPAAIKSLGSVRLRKGGVYLITGFGGLAQIFAKYLLEHYQATVFVTGRSSCDEGRIKVIEELARYGGRLHYIQADVSSWKSMHRVFEEIRKRYGRLNGIIHTAGIGSQNTFTNKNFKEFEETIRPKVTGTIILDELSRSNELDFMVYFSSLSALLGDFGECDYAVGNKFLDDYADFRNGMVQEAKRRGITISINWPLWREGGLHLGTEWEALYLKSSGMAYLDQKLGTALFEKILQQGKSPVVVVRGAKEKISRFLEIPPVQQKEGHQINTVNGAIPQNELTKGLQAQVKIEAHANKTVEHWLQEDLEDIITDILKVERELLKPEENFGQYGFDSITLRTFASRLSRRYSIELSPATLFAYSSIQALKRHLIEEYKDGLHRVMVSEVEVIDSPLKSTVESDAITVSTESTYAPVENNVPVVTFSPNEPVAVIGMDGVYPGAKDLTEFWRNLESENDLITEIPSERWNWRSFYDGTGRNKNKMNSKWGSFISGVDEFDAAFFNISPLEAQMMDPQHRWFLQSSWHAIENAGYRPSQLSGKKVGVFTGVQFNDYQQLIANPEASKPQLSTGNAHAMIANRVSFLLDLRGPSESIDTACSSSLTAVNRAVRAIQSGECEMALAGGVCINLSPYTMLGAAKLGVLSPDGKCKTFDESANGYVKGEGLGVFLLKPLSAAERDGDFIHAVIRATSVSHGGKAASLTAPNSEAQAELLLQTYEQAGISPETLTYCEMHGTGTALGDPVEVDGLIKAFRKYSERYGKSDMQRSRPYCGLGSIKTNIGHLEPASGIAGMTKVILSMNRGLLPGTPHLKTVNPLIKLENSPFYIVKKTQDWDRVQEGDQLLPRRAGVSSFGFGGAYAHVVLEEYFRNTEKSGGESKGLIVLSAKNNERLKAYAEQLLKFIQGENLLASKDLILERLAYTLQIGRDEYQVRLAIVADHLQDLCNKLLNFLDGQLSNFILHNQLTTEQKERQDQAESQIREALNTGNLERLGKLWVSGFSVPWEKLYARDMQRIPVPGYPFSPTKYWLTEAELLLGKQPEHFNQMNSSSQEEGMDHPFLSSFVPFEDGAYFTHQFHKDDRFIRDHIVSKKCIVPGVAYLEMARAAAVQFYRWKTEEIQIRDICWLNPVSLDQPTQIFLRLRTLKESNEAVFEITTKLDQEEILHAKGIVAQRVEDELMFSKSTNVNAIISRCTKSLNSAAIYENFQKIGLNYGKTYQAIDQLYYNEDEAVAELILPKGTEENSFILHPSLMDGALQSVIGLMGNGRENSENSWVPYIIEQLELNKTWSDRCYIHVTRNGLSSQVNKFNITVINEYGEIAAYVKSFVLRPLREKQEEKRTSLTSRESYSLTSHQNQSEELQDLNHKVQLFLKGILANQTRTPEEMIDPEEPLETYGIDSMLITSLTDELQSYVPGISRTLFFEYQTLAELSEFFVAEHCDKMIEITSKKVPQLTQSDLNAAIEVAAIFEIKTEKLTEKNKYHVDDDTEIAIVGLAGRYPDAPNLEVFWENLKVGRDSIREVGTDRWDHPSYYDPEKGKKGKTYSKWGGFLEDVDKFDPLFFNITPKEAELLDPQERLFLQTVWETVEDAGYTRKRLNNHKVGVYVGVMYGHYQLYGAEESLKGNVMAPSSSFASIANRVSYVFNFQGPSMAVDTMCSSSLTSIHLACESIRRGECQLAIAGGVNLTLHSAKYIMLSSGRFASSDGRCRSFGEGGDGYVPGEGVGAVLLKPLKQAIEDQDQIYGIIRGSAINHGGKTNGYSVPNQKAQTHLIEEVLQKTGISPDRITYLEAHGTGTSLGDPIEINALSSAFSKYTSDKQYCSIGSVKSNIGHLESAAGIAGLTKVLLQMKYGKLLPSLHSEKTNPNIYFENTPFYVQQHVQEWKRNYSDSSTFEKEELPYIAAVSSFGAGGSNGHMIIEEYRPKHTGSTKEEMDEQLILLSAKTKEQLRELSRKIQMSLTNEKEEVYTSLTPDLEKSIGIHLQQTAAEILQLSESELQLDGDLDDYGFDPVSLNKLISKVKEKFNIDVSISEIATHSTLKEIAQYLSKKSSPRNWTEALTQKKQQYQYRSLAEIAYTLQTGREPMEERIAFVVYSLVDLTSKLQQYADHGKISGDYVEGSTIGSRKGERTKIERVKYTSINDRDWMYLAKLWASGAEIDWHNLYIKRKPKIVSLPTYPFAKEKCWIPVTSKDKQQNKHSVCHPLLDRNISTFNSQVFEKEITGEEEYCKDHHVDGRRIFPGSCYLEMAVAACKLSAPTSFVYKLKNIAWRRSLFLPGEKVRLQVQLELEDEIKFQIVAHNDQNREQLYCNGEVMYSHSPTLEKCEDELDIASVRKDASFQLTASQIYERLYRKGLHYGDDFQVVQEMYGNEDEVLALLELPENLVPDFEEYLLHPILIDGAFQTVSGFSGENDTGYLPIGINELTIYSTLPRRMYVYACESEERQVDGVKAFVLYLADENGEIAVTIEGFTLKQMNLPHPPERKDEDHDLVTLEPVWIRQEGDDQGTKIISPSLIVLITKEKELVEQFKMRSTERVVWIRPGHSFLERARDELELSIGDPKSYEALATWLGDQKFDVVKIVHYLSLDHAENKIEVGFYSLFNLVQQLMNQKMVREVQTLYVHDNEYPEYEAVAGFAKTLFQENPRYCCKTVQLRQIDVSHIVQVLHEELNTLFHEPQQILYKGRERWIKVLKETDLGNISESVAPFRKDGVYLITGGAGGLGKIFAQQIAKNAFGCRIILVGRSPDLILGEWEKVHSTIEYHQADISDRYQVAALVKEIKAKYGVIHGVIHAAGVLRDSFIIKKKMKDIEEVLAAKRRGTLNLHEALKEEALDFFVVFSSTSAVLGNQGQSDYSFANAYMDSFVHYRERLREAGKVQGKSISINWPLWQKGGMSIPDQLAARIKANLGMVPLQEKHGWNVLKAVINQNKSQLAVIQGDRKKIRQVLKVIRRDGVLADVGK